MLFKGLEPLYIKVIHLKSIVSTISTKIAIYLYNIYYIYILYPSSYIYKIKYYNNNIILLLYLI